MACNEDCDQILLAGNKTSDEGWRENGEFPKRSKLVNILSFFYQTPFTMRMAKDCQGCGRRRRPWSVEGLIGETSSYQDATINYGQNIEKDIQGLGELGGGWFTRACFGGDSGEHL